MRLLIEGIVNPEIPTTRTAAMYYKTEPFYTDVNKYVHTNNWEILRATQILNSKGFSVDLIDRDNKDWRPQKKYDLFLGLGVGNSGKNFVRYSKASQAKVKVLLAMGPQPDVSNDLVLKRYESFQKRTGQYAPPMRTVSDVTGQKFVDIMNETDFVLTIGEKNSRSYDSYLPYGKPILNFYPAVSPAVSYDIDWAKTRSKSNFLCFAGNGFICKGVDIVTEAFLSMPDKNLHICGPMEEAFSKRYMQDINRSNNVKYHGFIEPGKDRFNHLASSCSFVVFHSSSESCCTSVATAMKSGLVPVINPWTSIRTDGCGIELSDEDDLIENVKIGTSLAAGLSTQEYDALLRGTLIKSSLYSQDSFTQSYTEAIEEIIGHI